ncbi:MAG: hypothetical protein ACYSR4_10525, partial [Planctomycetota bacterium]
MKKGFFRAIHIWVVVMACGCHVAADEGLVSWWKFDEDSGSTALDSVSGKRDAIKGNFRHI